MTPRCPSVYAGAQFETGAPVRCDGLKGHAPIAPHALHGNGFAARYWDDTDARAARGLYPVEFHLADGETIWQGFADGTTWNGFDNVQVTPETRAEIVRFCRFDDPLGTEPNPGCCAHPRADHPEVTERTMTVGDGKGGTSEVPLIGTPCTWDGCDCREWDDGASGFSDIPVTPETGLVDIGFGYVTTLHTAECGHDETEVSL